MSKVFNTRLQLKYDLWKNWHDNNPILLAGEIAVVYIPEETDATTGKVIQKPATMFKVGDGTSSFNSLDWASGLAADVYAWAKEASIPVVKEGNGNVVASIEWDAKANNGKGGLKYTTASVATSEGLAALQNALTELTTKVNNMYTNEQIDTAIATAKTGAETTAANALSAAKTELTTEINKKVDKVEGYSLVSDTEIARLSGVHNYDDAQIKADIAKKADSATMVTELGKKVDKVAGYSLVSDTEIARLAEVKNYDDAEVRGLIGDNADAIAEIAGDYVQAADIAEFETKANVKKVADDLAAYVTSNDAAVALKADKSVVDAMYNNAQIDGFIAEAKKYADDNDADTKYGIVYDSDNKKIKLVEGGTDVEIDASAFIKDGMISEVTIGDDNDLIITFNTDAGKENIVLPLDQLVDIYTGVEGTRVKVTVNADKSISADLVAGSISKDYLDADVKASLALADSAVQDISHLATTEALNGVDAKFANYTNTADMNAKLDLKADKTQVATDIADAKAHADTKAGAAETNAKVYTDTKIGEVNTEVAKKANDADLKTVAKTGDIKDLTQVEDEYVIFYCGNASTFVGTDADAIPAPSAE